MEGANAEADLREVMDGGHPGIAAARGCSHGQVQEKIARARRLKAQVAAEDVEDDWSMRDYLEAGRRG